MIKVIDYVTGYGRQVVFEAERAEKYAREVAFAILYKSHSAVIEIDSSENKFWDGLWYMETGNPFPVHKQVRSVDMKTYRDTTTGEVMTYEEIVVNFKAMKAMEPAIWDENDDVDDFIGFHIMCGDIEEVK